jgi:hypothetical protein
MNARTILSAKGQAVISREVRDEPGLLPGPVPLDVARMGDGLRPPPLGMRGKLSVEEALVKIREISPRYTGPGVSIEGMNETIREMWVESASQGDCADMHRVASRTEERFLALDRALAARAGFGAPVAVTPVAGPPVAIDTLVA